MSRSDREGWNQLTWLFKFARIRICQCAALSVICFANASSPKGRAEKPVRAESLTNRGSSDTDLFVCCSFRHGLRRATFLREEGFGFPRKPNLSLPPGEMSRSDREGWNQLTWLFKLSLTRAFLSCAQTKTEHLSILCLLVGGGGFEPPKSLTTDLQSAPFGHSGNLPYSLAEIVELVDGLEPPTC